MAPAVRITTAPKSALALRNVFPVGCTGEIMEVFDNVDPAERAVTKVATEESGTEALETAD